MKKEQTPCCKQVADYLCTHLDEKLNSRNCKKVREHLETCSNCAALLRSLKIMITLYQQEPYPELSRSEQDRCIQKVLECIHTVRK